MDYKIFIAEDDDVIANAVIKRLSEWNFIVKRAENYRDVLSEFEDFSPHITLLDISLPFRSGYFWCGEIRKVSKCPVIFISSASDNMNVITAIDMGADDFVAKPFDVNVLIAKIRALLRRSYDFAEGAVIIEHNGALLNIADATLTAFGERVELTKNEFRVLQTLLENKGKIVTREELMNRLWETEDFIDENALYVNIARLRRKLDAAGLEGFITTKVGRGYIV